MLGLAPTKMGIRGKECLSEKSSGQEIERAMELCRPRETDRGSPERKQLMQHAEKMEMLLLWSSASLSGKQLF